MADDFGASDVSDIFQLPQANKISSAAASKIAQNPQQFFDWAALVNLDPNPLDGERLPEFLQKQLEDSKLVPSWMSNAETPQYKSLRQFYKRKVDLLATDAPVQLKPCSSDQELTHQELSDELGRALPIILRVASQRTYFNRFKPRPTEADRRRPMDHLNDHVWQIEGGLHFLHRAECHLQLPRPAASSFHTTKPDSAIFLQSNISSDQLDFPQKMGQACCSIAYPDTYASALHWVNEFERESGEETSKRRVWMAMVSGLYQRRALGFKDHYVYGTAHYSSGELTVFAGAWNNKASKGEILSKDAKIILYDLGTFFVGYPTDMVRLYLLMRLARGLGLEYQRSLEEIEFTHVRQILTCDEGLHSWPPEPDSRLGRSKSKSSARRTKKRRLLLVEEARDSAASLEYALSEPGSPFSPGPSNTGQSACLVGVDDPLKRQFVDVLSRKGEWVKVHGYLASSVHERYDYEVGGIDGQVEGDDERGHNSLARDD